MTTHTIKEGFTYQDQAYNILITLPEAVSGFEHKEEEIKKIIATALAFLAEKSNPGREFKPLSTRFIIPLNEAEKPKVSYKQTEEEAEEDLSGVALVDLIDYSRFRTIADLLRTIPAILKTEQLAIHHTV